MVVLWRDEDTAKRTRRSHAQPLSGGRRETSASEAILDFYFLFGIIIYGTRGIFVLAPITVAHTVCDKETEERQLFDKEILLRTLYSAALALVVVSIISLFVNGWLSRPTAIAVIVAWVGAGIWRRYRHRRQHPRKLPVA